jgi:enoyl-CoA hydratase
MIAMKETDAETVLRRRVGSVEVVTINRPAKRNALDDRTIDGLAAAMTECTGDDAVQAIVLTGAGDRAFCAGMDLSAYSSGQTPTRAAGTATLMSFMRGDLPIPVVAAVNGTAVAGGMELAMACDLVVSASHALFGLPEVKRGLIPGVGAALLPQLISRAMALELVLTGELVSAERALQLGLVNRVVAASDVLSTATDLAAAIAANAPLAVRAARAVVREAARGSFDAAWSDGLKKATEMLGTDDAREGARAFVERRAPQWSGR